jgi:branched-chain amino acid transport system permease protein
MLLGRNGAGKTTTLRTIMGLWRASAGEIRFEGADLTKHETPAIAVLGIAYVPESMGIFAGLTVHENLLLAARKGPLDDARLEWIFRFFPALKKFWFLPAGLLSADRSRCSRSRARSSSRASSCWSTNRRKGLAPSIINNLIEAFQELKKTDTSILMVEQNFHAARSLGDSVSVMDSGRIVHSGRMRDLAADEGLQTRLLGCRSRCTSERACHADRRAAASTHRFRAGSAGGRDCARRVRADRQSVDVGDADRGGLAMGLLIFIMASGLTLVFGLMDVMNFAHGLFIAIGAYVAVSVIKVFRRFRGRGQLSRRTWLRSSRRSRRRRRRGLLGLFFERVIIRPVYGQHLKQILITTGGMIVAEQLIHVLWGPDQLPLLRPPTLRGSFLIGDIALEKIPPWPRSSSASRSSSALVLLLNRTKIGLLIRAGVENKEMVEAMGYRIRRLFVAVFVAGAALAGLGGALWGMYQESVTVLIGAQMMVLIFIVIIIGGLGSVGGCFVGALLVGLVANYVGYLSPKIALGSNILLMVIILLWRPQGLYPMSKQ